ncbi:hypothetical protein BY996DRAFT_6459143 [Phakopsora pachyrhizi]|nr:hypothetical protein BY996DRAFT_6459143 [Phakopsora pachyrhizi]
MNKTKKESKLLTSIPRKLFREIVTRSSWKSAWAISSLKIIRDKIVILSSKEKLLEDLLTSDDSGADEPFKPVDYSRAYKEMTRRDWGALKRKKDNGARGNFIERRQNRSYEIKATIRMDQGNKTSLFRGTDHIPRLEEKIERNLKLEARSKELTRRKKAIEQGLKKDFRSNPSKFRADHKLVIDGLL